MRPPVRFLPYHLQHQSLVDSRLRARAARGLVVRGVVTDVYEYDSSRRRNRRIEPGGFVCDVKVYESFMQTLLREVPIATSSAGLNDYEAWKPRAATQTLSGGELVISLEGGEGRVTPAEEMDGDHVLVGFIGGDLQSPIILHQLPHPKSKRRASATDVTKYKYQRWIRGIRLGITEAGNLELDTTNASAGALDSNGNEIASAGAGDIEITMKSGKKVSVRAPTLAAPQPLLQSTTFLADLKLAIEDLVAGLVGVPYTATIAADFAAGIPTAGYPTDYLESD